MTTATLPARQRAVIITGITIGLVEQLKHSLLVKLSIDGTEPRSVSLKRNEKPVGDHLLENALILTDESRLSVQILEKHRLRRDQTLAQLNFSLEHIWSMLESSAPDAHTQRYLVNLPDPTQQLWLNVTVVPESPESPDEKDQTYEKARNDPAIAAKALQEATQKLQQFKTILGHLGTTKDPLRQALEIAEAVSELHPIAKAVVKVVGVIYGHFKTEDNHREEMLSLAENMARTLGSLPTVDNIAEFPKLKDTINTFPDLLGEFVNFMEKWLASSISKFLNVGNNQDKINDLKARFETFKEEFDRGVAIDSAEKIDYVAKSQKLDDLRRRLGGIVTVKPRANECLEGTRTSILSEIEDKIRLVTAVGDTTTEAPEGGNIIWIRGAPGSGKSAVSLTLKSRLHQSGRLVTYFRFDRNDATVTTSNALWSRVAYDLADRYPSVLKHNLALLQENKANLTSTTDLFTFLVGEPLLKLTEPPPTQPIVIVIDALDECGGFIGPSSPDRQALLQTLARWPRLPTHFKLLVTSREEGDISRVLSSISSPIDIPSGHLLTDNPSAEASILASKDIHSFLEMRFRQIREPFPSLHPDWPGTTIVAEMVRRAAGNFMWATAASIFIKSGLDPQEQLERIIAESPGSTGMKPLNSLYLTILETSFGNLLDNSSDAQVLRAILGTIVFAQRPFRDPDFTCLPTSKPVTMNMVASIRDRLHSVVDQGTVLRFVHKSFDDFLLSADCPPKYAISMEESHRLLTQLCLNTMAAKLRFNICGLQTSCLRNKDVPDIDARVKDCIPNVLAYSCCFWADHLIRIPFNNELMSDVKQMILDKLLYWLEAMSVLDKISRVSYSMRLVLDWFKSTSDTEFRLFIHDAHRFIGAFSVPIALSAPHIYISALPFAPENSLIAQHFLPRFPRILALSKGKPTNWSSCIFASSHHKGILESVSFSTDEKYFVTAFNDGTTLLCDSETGYPILSPFTGPNGLMHAFFSPDGRRIWTRYSDGQVIGWDLETGSKNIAFQAGTPGKARDVIGCYLINSGQNIVSVSASKGTVTLWNADSGEQLQVLFRIPKDDKFPKVSFSLDGCYMAWAGRDDTYIRIWRLVDGHEIRSPPHYEPQFGRSKRISTLSFAIDALLAVSASMDGRIIIVDAKTGRAIGPPLATGRLPMEVAYSHKHKLVVVGSGLPGTIMVWNADTHEAILGPLEGHTAPIQTIALSRDGQRALSASPDGTVRMWGLERKGQVSESYATKGHKGPVCGVAFSPCGKKLASVGYDETLRVWGVSTGNPLLGPISTSTFFLQLIFSPDGSQIITFDSPNTIFQVWNADTGEPILGPNVTYGDEGQGKGLVKHLAFRSTDNRLVMCSRDDILRSWRLEDNVLTEDLSVSSPQPVDASKPLKVLAISPDGLSIIVRDRARNPQCYAYSTTTSQPLPLVFADDEYLRSNVVYSRTGRLLSASYDSQDSRSTLRVWSTENGELVAGPATVGTRTLSVFSPDDHHMALRFPWVRTSISMWNTRAPLMVLGPWMRHADVITALAFSPDGEKIVSASHDGQIRFWDTASLLGSNKSTGFLGAGTQILNGWVMDEDGNLMFWVPNDHRSRLVWPDDVLTIGGTGIPTELDLTRFKYGENWTECFGGGE